MEKQQLPPHLIPAEETQRLRKLAQYDILASAPEIDFDTITNLAAHQFNTSAFISFIGENEVFYKSHTDKDSTFYIQRNTDLSALCVVKAQTIVLTQSSQFAELANLSGFKPPALSHFFVAAPIRSPDGYVIGAIGVCSDQPTETPAPAKLLLLESLAQIIIDKLEARKAYKNTIHAYDNRLHRLAHDMKNPITSISLYSQLLSSRVTDPEKVKEMSSRIGSAAKEVEKSIDQLLTNIRTEDPSNTLIHQQVQIASLLKKLEKSYDYLLKTKNQNVQIGVIPDLSIAADEAKIMEIFAQLLSNASKYAAAGSTISINASLSPDHHLIIAFKDQGQGLTSADLDKLYIKFARLSSKPTAREKSYGLGLAQVKMLTESFKGKIWVQSEGKDKGSTFFVSFPISQTAAKIS